MFNHTGEQEREREGGRETEIQSALMRESSLRTRERQRVNRSVDMILKLFEPSVTL